MSTQDDRRKFRRIQVNLPAQLEGVEPPSEPVQIAVADVSFGGLGLVAAAAIPPGTQVKLTWHRPPFQPIGDVVCLGRIKNVRQKSAPPGLFFLNMAFEDVDSHLVQKILGWAQMQSFAQARSRTRAASGLASKHRHF